MDFTILKEGVMDSATMHLAFPNMFKSGREDFFLKLNLVYSATYDERRRKTNGNSLPEVTQVT